MKNIIIISILIVGLGVGIFSFVSNQNNYPEVVDVNLEDTFTQEDFQLQENEDQYETNTTTNTITTPSSNIDSTISNNTQIATSNNSTEESSILPEECAGSEFSIDVSSPTNGQIFSLGDTFEISWEHCNPNSSIEPTLISLSSYDASSGVFIEKLNLSLHQLYTPFVSPPSSNSVNFSIPNTQNYTAPLNSNTANMSQIEFEYSNASMVFDISRKYKVSVEVEGPDGYVGSSDYFFIIP